MKQAVPEAIQAILQDHAEWLHDPTRGRQADLSRRYLKGLDLAGRDLRKAIIRHSDLREVDFTLADLSGADLTGSLLMGATFRGADLSGVQGWKSPLDVLAKCERTTEGLLVYKHPEAECKSPDHWEWREGAILSEVVNPDRGGNGSGVHVGTLGWVKASLEWLKGFPVLYGTWQGLIRWEWLAGVVVPFGSGGEFKTERLELIRKVNPIEVRQAEAYTGTIVGREQYLA